MSSNFSRYVIFGDILPQLKLSHEHQGFIFEPDATKSVDLLVEHSGGKVSKALRKAIKQDEIKSAENRLDAMGTAEDSKIPSG